MNSLTDDESKISPDHDQPAGRSCSSRPRRSAKGRGESRSELFRRALETLFEKQRYETAVTRYVEGYVAEPESEYEIAAAEVTEAGAFEADEEWE